jgi:hypothetical protein
MYCVKVYRNPEPQMYSLEVGPNVDICTVYRCTGILSPKCTAWKWGPMLILPFWLSVHQLSTSFSSGKRIPIHTLFYFTVYVTLITSHLFLKQSIVRLLKQLKTLNSIAMIILKTKSFTGVNKRESQYLKRLCQEIPNFIRATLSPLDLISACLPPPSDSDSDNEES